MEDVTVVDVLEYLLDELVLELHTSDFCRMINLEQALGI